jgi:DNA-binding transcriptional LysR family regulator
MTPTENELKYFLEVYTEKHFTKAATKIGVSQPTLTQSIAKLEKKVGSVLFIRTKRGCSPTKSANYLFEKSSQMLEIWKEITQNINSINTNLIGTFRVGCHQSVAQYTMPSFIKKINSKAPDIQIKMTHDWSRIITEKVLSCEVDIGFVVNPIKHPDLVMIKLGSDIVTAWVKNKKTVPQVLLTDLTQSQLHEKFKKEKYNKFKGWNIVTTPSLELIRTMALNGSGVGILPERVTKAIKSNLEIYDKDFPVRYDDIYIIYRYDSLKSTAGRLLVEVGKSCLV